MIGDKQPDKFAKGQRLTASALNTIVSAVMQMIRRMYGARIEQPLDIVCILDASLAAATDSKTGASSALATVCEWSGTAYSETSRSETVWNHSEHSTHAVNTFGIGKWIDGHWIFFGDCDAMGSR